MRDGLAFVASSGSNSLAVLDVSDAAAPSLVACHADATYLGGAKSIHVLGAFAFVVGDPYLTVVDVSTPVTTEHYLAAERGASYGLAATPERFGQAHPGFESRVRGLFLAGQDTLSLGVCGAMIAGFMAALRLEPRIALAQWRVVAAFLLRQ